MKQVFVKTLASVALFATAVYSQNMPFPQQKSYNGCIKPDVAQSTMDAQVKSVYDDYKSRFLADYHGGYIYKSTATDGAGSTATVSEQHGWGMVITAMMAGYDSDAKTIFDKMLSVYTSYKNSGPGSNLMAWELLWGGSADRSSNATDGDLDIAYALLLAYKQWGDANYYNTAKAIVNDIKQYNINSSTKHVLLGNWATAGEELYNYTRPSDWMGGHFRTFADAFSDSNWDTIADKIYDIYNKFQSNSYATSGLISDFVYYDGSSANSTESYELTQHGETNQDKYSTNAARVPWRMAADYALSQNSAAKGALDQINGFLNGKSLTYSNIREGYYLSGDPLNNNAGGAAYLAPFVAARIASTDKNSLTTGWNSLVSTTPADAYQAAIKLQSMLLISGNWWHYNDANTVGNEPTFDTAGVYLDQFGDADPQTDLEKGFGEEAFGSAESWQGGYGWMVEDWQPGKIKTSQGNVWQAEVWDGDNLTNPGNLSEAFVSGNLNIQFEDSSALYTNFPNVDKDDNKTDWFNLSAMTGLTIKGKGTGTITVIFNTDNEGTLSNADSSFWGGYAATITLDGTMKEHQVVADLFSPRPYSEEAAKAWTWKDNGSSKVSGISLFAEKGLNAEIEFIKINGANIKNETFGFKTPEDVDPIDGENVVAHGDWNVYVDTLGTSVGAAQINSGKLEVTMKRGAFSATDAYDTYASLSGFSENADFSSLESVQITYTSTQPLKLALPITGKTDVNGTAHYITLPASSSSNTVTAPVANFKQPSWTEAADSTNLDLTKVGGISIEIDSDAQDELNASFVISEMILKGATVTPVAAENNLSSIAKAGVSTLSATAGMLKTAINATQAGEMNIAIVNLQGRVISQKNISVRNGVNALSLDMSGNAKGLYFMVVNGAGVQVKEKFILQ